jgi:hypothetical protein
VCWPANVWMGLSVEDAGVLYRVDDLREASAAVRFLPCEPLLGPLDALPECRRLVPRLFRATTQWRPGALGCVHSRGALAAVTTGGGVFPGYSEEYGWLVDDPAPGSVGLAAGDLDCGGAAGQPGGGERDIAVDDRRLLPADSRDGLPARSSV